MTYANCVLRIALFRYNMIIAYSGSKQTECYYSSLWHIACNGLLRDGKFNSMCAGGNIVENYMSFFYYKGLFLHLALSRGRGIGVR